MMGLDGGIIAHRHRSIRPSFRTLIADGDPLLLAPFPRSRWPGAGVPKKGGNRPILIRDYGRKEGPVNCRGVARDVRGYRRGEIMDNRHRAGRPSFRPLLEEEGPLFPAPLPRRRGAPGASKNGQMEEFLSAASSREEGFLARRRLAAISRSASRRVPSGQSPPRQTTLFQRHNRANRQPISDTIDNGVITSNGGTGGNRHRRFAPQIPPIAFPRPPRA